MALVEKYHPKTFEGVREQKKAVAILSGLVLRGAPHNVLLYGAYGAGKTTLAPIYAKALNCTQSNASSGSPCNQDECPTCSDPKRYFHEFDVPRHGAEAGHIIQLIDAKLHPTGIRERTIIFLDEAQELKASDASQLLKRLEDMTANVTFIFATTEPWRLPKTIRSRLQPVQLHPLSLPASKRFLEEIAARELLVIEPAASALIAAVAKGHPRDLLNRLDSVLDRREGASSHVTEALVRSRLGIDADTFLVRYFQALSGKRIDEATIVLHEWPAEWQAKSRWVQSFLLLIYHDLMQLEAFVDPYVDAISASHRQEIIATFCAQWKCADNIAMRVPWRSLMAIWTTTEIASTDANIRMRFAEFEAKVELPMMNTAAKRSVTTPVHNMSVPRLSNNPALLDDVTSSNGFLTLGHVIEMIERASYFVQENGVGFNFALRYIPPAASREDTTNAIANIDAFVKALLAFDGSSALPQAALVLHGRDGKGVYAEVVGRVCDPNYARLSDWLSRDCYRVSPGSLEVDLDKKQLKFHWKSVARLCASLPPGLWPKTPLKKRLGVNRAQDPGPILAPFPILRFHAGVSDHMLRGASQLGMPFLSAVKDGVWDFVVSGWELSEALDRRKLSEERQKELSDQLSSIQRQTPDDANAAAARLGETWSSNPHDHVRSWRTWW